MKKVDTDQNMRQCLFFHNKREISCKKPDKHYSLIQITHRFSFFIVMILLIEDAQDFGQTVRDYLTLKGHSVERVKTVSQAKLLIARHHHDIGCIILDWMLPDGDGPSLCQWIKEHYTIPVIMSTARSQIDDTLEGFDAGADDYLRKPYDLRELDARIQVVGKRSQGYFFTVHTPNASDIIINPDAMVISTDHGSIECGANERHAIKRFCLSRGSVVSRVDLIDEIWGGDARGAENNLDVLISMLRKKLGKDAIVTVKGIGYRMG